MINARNDFLTSHTKVHPEWKDPLLLAYLSASLVAALFLVKVCKSVVFYHSFTNRIFQCLLNINVSQAIVQRSAPWGHPMEPFQNQGSLLLWTLIPRPAQSLKSSVKVKWSTQWTNNIEIHSAVACVVPNMRNSKTGVGTMITLTLVTVPGPFVINWTKKWKSIKHVKL